MKFSITLAVLSIWACACPARAFAGGAWSTLVRAYNYTDLLAEDGVVWCATLEAGLLRLSPASGRFDSFTREPDALASNRDTALALDRSGRLWVGTRGAGASLLAADRASWGVVNAFDGLPSDTVNVVNAEGDTVWIGTTRGLALWIGHEISGRLPDGTNPSPFTSDFISGIA